MRPSSFFWGYIFSAVFVRLAGFPEIRFAFLLLPFTSRIRLLMVLPRSALFFFRSTRSLSLSLFFLLQRLRPPTLCAPLRRASSTLWKLPFPPLVRMRHDTWPFFSSDPQHGGVEPISFFGFFPNSVVLFPHADNCPVSSFLPPPCSTRTRRTA